MLIATWTNDDGSKQWTRVHSTNEREYHRARGHQLVYVEM